MDRKNSRGAKFLISSRFSSFTSCCPLWWWSPRARTIHEFPLPSVRIGKGASEHFCVFFIFSFCPFNFCKFQKTIKMKLTSKLKTFSDSTSELRTAVSSQADRTRHSEWMIPADWQPKQWLLKVFILVRNTCKTQVV